MREYPRFFKKEPLIFGVKLTHILMLAGLMFVLSLAGIKEEMILVLMFGAYFLLALKEKYLEPSFFYFFIKKEESIKAWRFVESKRGKHES